MADNDHILSSIVETKAENGRISIRVKPDEDKSVLFNGIKNIAEENKVVNIDYDRIREVVDSANNIFEDIGEDFIFYDPKFDEYLIVKKKPLKATLMIKREYVEEDNPMNTAILEYRLSRAEITYGILKEQLQKMIDEEILEENITVAEGTEPVPGRDGGIDYKVSLSKDLTPSVKDDGSVDFREVKSITQLKTGDIIAERVPPTKGTPGKAVTGEVIDPTPGKPYTLQAFENISVSEDGEKLIAQKNGVLSRENENLALKDYLEINSDVDFEVGNINFPGKIIVNGDVKPGFTVESADDILIHGDVEAATIKSTDGSVQIEKGVIGKDETYIYSPKRVNVNFAQNCTIETEGVINVENSLLHCTCICQNLTGEANSKIIGGEITAEESIDIFQSGNTDGTKTILCVDDKTRRELQNKRAKLQEGLKLLETQKLPLMRDFRNKKSMIKKMGQNNLSQKVKKEVIKAANRVKALDNKIGLINNNLSMIEEELNKDVNESGYVVIADTIYAGTLIKLYQNRHKVSKDTQALIFEVKNGDISITHKK
ncbi:MAG: DUF342 domain-containing protein [Fibrobacterota bacterium]